MCTTSNTYPQEFFLTALKIEDKDITSLYDAFRRADPSCLLNALLLIDASWRSSPSSIHGQARQSLVRRIEASLNLMHALDPAVGRICNELIIPWQDFHSSDDSRQIARGLGACILDCNSVQAADSEVSKLGGHIFSMSGFHERIQGGEDPLEMLESIGLLKPISIISMESWPEIMGRTIWLPSSLCTLEWHSVLASVFWSMTYSGFGDAIDRDARMGRQAQISDDVALFDYKKKMDLFADVLNYNNWVDTVRAGKDLAERMHQSCR